MSAQRKPAQRMRFIASLFFISFHRTELPYRWYRRPLQGKQAFIERPHVNK